VEEGIDVAACVAGAEVGVVFVNVDVDFAHPASAEIQSIRIRQIKIVFFTTLLQFVFNYCKSL